MLPGLRAGQGVQGTYIHFLYLRVSGSVFPLGVEKGGSGKNYT